MTKTSFRVNAEFLLDLLLPGKRLRIECVDYEPGCSFSFHVEHDEHDIPAGEVAVRLKTVGPVIGGRGEYATVLDGFDAVKPLSRFQKADDSHRGTGRSFKQLTELVEMAISEPGAACVFVTPGEQTDYWVNTAEKAAAGLGIRANYWPEHRVMTFAGGFTGSIRFVGEDHLRRDPDKLRGLDIKYIVWDHACFATAMVRSAIDAMRIETKPATVPSTAPTPQPNSPTPAPAPSTTNAPPVPETKEGGIGNAICVTKDAERSYKP